MFILDLQWLIFVLVLILLLAMGLAPQVEHQPPNGHLFGRDRQRLAELSPGTLLAKSGDSQFEPAKWVSVDSCPLTPKRQCGWLDTHLF